MDRRTLLGLIGPAAIWPSAAFAQQAPARRVGVLMSTTENDPVEISSLNAFSSEMTRLGWEQGKNLDLNVLWGAADAKRMSANAEKLVGLQTEVILAKGAAVPSARQATTTIPIVFVSLPDPIVQNLVGSFSRPTGNITGFTTHEFGLVGKRLGLLRDISPGSKRVLYLRSRQSGVAGQPLLDRVVENASAIGTAVADGAAQSPAEIESAVQAFANEPDGAILVAFDAFTLIHRQTIVELAARFRLPAVYPASNFAGTGGLCSYGFDQDQQFRDAATYVSRLLAGARPADLPVQIPTKFQLTINSRTANALGLQISPGLLAAADSVIE